MKPEVSVLKYFQGRQVGVHADSVVLKLEKVKIQ